MTLLPKTLVGRTIAVLLLSVGILHLFSIYIYQNGLETVAGAMRDRELAERLVTARRTIAEAPLTEREHAAHGLSTPTLQIHWSPQSVVNAAPSESARAEALRQRMLQLSPDLDAEQIHLGYVDDAAGEPTNIGDAHPLLASLQLGDGSWINFTAATLPAAAARHGALLSTTAMAVGIVIISVALVRTITAPLRALALAADRTGVDVSAPGMRETGPEEVRHAAVAFNRMQDRLRRSIHDRANMLAAVSHDLKTPITRMRLRAEFISDETLRQEMDDDLSEMEAMIESTLAFLRGETETEETRVVDVVAILETICDDLADRGHRVELLAPPQSALLCRSLAIKRALSNLTDNAVKYGGNATVSLVVRADELEITIDDDGPGILPDQIDAVFSPFHRLESSRSRETGGSGLGLTVARSLIRSHGGDVGLQNRPGGGLRAMVRLPRIGQEATQSAVHDMTRHRAAGG